MNKRVISVISIMLLTLTMTAQERSDAQMMSIAKAQLAGMRTVRKAKGTAAETLTLKTVREDSQYRMYAAEDGSGYVVVARNEAFSPIIGYSTEPTTGEIPCCMRACLDMINHNLEARLTSAETEEATGSDGATYEVVEPMLTTYWSQGNPYNLKCPADYTGETSVTGCVATAMAMVMKHFRYPASVEGKEGFYLTKINSSGTTGDTIWTTISSSYDWDKMLDKYSSSSSTEAKEAVSQLMFDCGQAVGMKYGSSASSGSTTTAAQRFYSVFGYAAVNHASKDYYSDWEWRQLVYDQLKAGCPLMHSGQDPDNGGHAFIFDGVDANGLVHINWGWGSSTAGYFDMLALTPTTSSKSYNFAPTGFIYNLKPTLGEGEEQELQLVVGRGTGQYKDDYYTIRLNEENHVILNTGSVFNWTPVPIRGYVGVRYENLDGGTNYNVRLKTGTGGYYVPMDAKSRSGAGYGSYSLDHDQTPSTIKPGTYKVYFAGYNDDRDNLKVRCHIRQRYKGYIYWILTVADDGTLTLSDEKVVTSPETANPTGISHVTTSNKPADNRRYNLNGQRVGSDYRGIVIVNGKKVVLK